MLLAFNVWPLATAGAAALTTISLAVFFVSRYKRCPANKILVVSGKVGDGKSAKCISGGGTFVWPVLQEYDWLDLTPLPLDIDLKDALSLENIRVAVPATVTVAISREPDIQQNAAVRLLGLTNDGIKQLAIDIIIGAMRQVIASMRIEDINRDRDAFLKKIDDSLEPELRKIGLLPINVNIRDIRDASGFIEATGRKAASQAVNQANADVADQEKLGKIRVAEASQEQEIRVAEAGRTKEIGVRSASRDTAIQVAEFNKDQLIKVAAAEASAAEGQATATVKKAEAYQKAETAKAVANGMVQVAQNEALTRSALANAKRVEAEKRTELEAVARAEAAKIIVDAEAAAKQRVMAAEAEAKSIFVRLKAEADGQLAVLEARAEGMRKLVEAAGGAEQARSLLMVEHIDHLADAMKDAVAGIKFDKVVVWGGGQGGEVPNFVNGLVSMIPPLLDTMTKIGGVKVALPGVSVTE